MTEEEREQFRAKLTVMQNEIRAISESAAKISSRWRSITLASAGSRA